jgi:DNA-binding winged helix-turn-helix (wHTH) protein
VRNVRIIRPAMTDKVDRRPEDVLIEALVEAAGRASATSYEFDAYGLDIADHRLVHNGSPVYLRPKEFETLRLLVEHHGQLVSKQMMLDRVWSGTFVGDDTITQPISLVRRALGDDAGHVRFIETVPRRGYRFIAPVREIRT